MAQYKINLNSTSSKSVRKRPSHGVGGNLYGDMDSYESLNRILYRGREDRLDRYRIYDAMDEDLDISRALDMIAEHCTTKDANTNIPLKFEFKDDTISVADTDALHECLKIWTKINDWDNRIWRVVRNTIKYGDSFFVRDPETFELLAVPARNVVGIYVDENNDIVSYHMNNLSFQFDFMDTDIRDVNVQGPVAPIGYPVQSQKETEGTQAIIPAEHVLHLSMSEGREIGGSGAHEDVWPFGDSFLEGVFKDFKRRDLLESAALIHRVQRAPSRWVWYVDVGRMRPDKAESFMRRFKNNLMQKRVPYQFGQDDRFDSVYNPITMIEDIYLPQTPDGRGSKVDNLEGSQWNSMDDLKYFTGKVLRGLRVPTSFMLGPEEGGAQFQDGRTGVAYIQEMQFARFCERIQDLLDNDFSWEFKMFVKARSIQIHSSEFELKFVPPMNFDEYREGALNEDRLNRIGQAAGMPFLAKRFLLMKYGGFDQDDLLKNEEMWREENSDTAPQQSPGSLPSGIFGGGGSFDVGGGGPAVDTDFGGEEGIGGDVGTGDEIGGGGPGGFGGPPAIPTGPGGPGGFGAGGGVSPGGFEATMYNVDSNKTRLMEQYGWFKDEDGWKRTTPPQRALVEEASPVPVKKDGKEEQKTGVGNDVTVSKFTKKGANGERPVFTLGDLRRLRLEQERDRVETYKRIKNVRDMYGPQEEGGLGGF